MNVLMLFLGCGVIELVYPCDDPWYRDQDGDGFAPDDGGDGSSELLFAAPDRDTVWLFPGGGL